MRNQTVPQLNCVVEGLDSQRYILEPRQAKEIRARTERDYEMVVWKYVDMTIEAVGDRDASSFEIYSFYISREGLYAPEELPKRIDDGVHFKIARRDFMQHRCE